MFNNNYDKYPNFQYNYELYPNREQQLNFVRSYIKKIKDVHHRQKMSDLSEVIEQSSSDENEQINIDEEIKKDDEILKSLNLNEEQLLKEANYFALASHIFWAFWGVCMAGNSQIKFGYFVRIEI